MGAIDGGELVFGDTVSPVIFGGTGGIHTGIGAIDEDILNREDHGIGVACHHGFDDHSASAAPIVGGAVAVIEQI